jgi:hypothetical protein
MAPKSLKNHSRARLGASRRLLGPSWGSLGALGVPLGASWGALGASWWLLGRFKAPLGRSRGALQIEIPGSAAVGWSRGEGI